DHVLKISAQNPSIKIYPNPARDVLNISSNNEILEIEIIDFYGRTISFQNTNNLKNIAIVTNNLKNGIYTLKVISRNSVESHRFILSK
ncbi:MAG: T9SS type A sorting domain-containing protein, partial [Bacteroidia bacterium]